MCIILHIAAIDGERITGLNQAIPQVLDSFVDSNIKVALLSSYKNGYNKGEKFPVFNNKNHRIRYDSLQSLPEPYNKPSLIVFHSTYILLHVKIAREATKLGIPYIITPHSGMTYGAQKQKWFKKSIANILFFNKFVRESKAIHCLTKNEELDVKLKWDIKTFIVSNGIRYLKEFKNYEPTPDLINISFIGRLDIHQKGLDILLYSVRNIYEALLKKKVKINLYGPDYNGSRKKLLQLIDRLNLEEVIRLHGPVFDQEKHNILSKTDLFIHTSRFEGHPMAVLEALSHGIPCILSPGANMSEILNEFNVGWSTTGEIVDVSNTILNAVEEFISDNESYLNKRYNAKKLIENKFLWGSIVEELMNEYKKVLNK